MKPLKTNDVYAAVSDEYLHELFTGIDFKLPPRRHQYLTMYKTVVEQSPYTLCFHDIGTGKTYTAVCLLALYQPKKVLVVGPKSSFPAWEKHLRDYSDYSYIVLDGNTDLRKEKMDDNNHQVYITNYEALKYLYGCKFGGKWSVDTNMLVHNFDCVIYDEVHRAGSPTSVQHDVCFSLSFNATNVIALTGTPIDKSLLDLWGIFQVVDKGELFGNNFYSFRNKYFKCINKFYWVPQHGMKQEILDKSSSSSTYFSRQDCWDLPPQEWITVEIDYSAEQNKMRKEVLKGAKASFAEGKLTKGVLEKASTALKQINGGFLYLKDTDEERVAKRVKNNPKLDTILEYIDETQGKIVVFHRYIEEGKILEDALKKKKIKYVTLNGQTKNKDKSYKDFIGKKDIKVLIGHPDCAGESYDMTCASVMFFYSNPDKLRSRQQAEGRIWRAGQKHKCLYVDFMMRNSEDQIIKRNLGDKKKGQEELFDSIRAQI